MWRRNKKRMQQEDATDKHASLDFGLGEYDRQQKGPEMSQQEKVQHANRSRGMSLEDMMEGPFVIPSGERGSMRSLSRLSDAHDPYRPVHLLKSTSQLSLSRPPTYNSRPASGKSASIWTSASGDTAHSMKSSLVANAQNPSRTDLVNISVNSSSSTSASNSPPSRSPIDIPEAAFIPPRLPISPTLTPPPHQRLVREGSDAKGAFVPRESVPSVQSATSLPAAPATTQPAIPAVVAAAIAQMTPLGTQPRQVSPQNQPQHIVQSIERPDQQQPKQSASGHPRSARKSNGTRASVDNIPSSPISTYDDSETYADVLGIAQKESKSPPLDRAHHPKPMPTVPEGGPVQSGLGLQGVKYDTRNSPPAEEQHTAESAELRANRVRSFYKEYFDSSPVQNQQRTPRHHAHTSSSYSQDYNQEHFYGAPIYDPTTGEFYMAGAPYAQPMNRRAMTPPPRAPPKSFRNSPGPRSASASRRPRGYSASSTHRRRNGTPNSFSSRGRAPRRTPPAPLTVLPTPAQMKDDSAIFSPTDFAPPTSVKSRAAGMSPHGGERVPYQGPGRRAFSPLASSFDDLAFMPHPYVTIVSFRAYFTMLILYSHNLRKSASFTALDFAPPQRFGAQQNQSSTGHNSENGSVRSGRSHGTSVSAAQLASIRAGAYRLSRLPKDFVGGKGEIDLKPRMDISRV